MPGLNIFQTATDAENYLREKAIKFNVEEIANVLLNDDRFLLWTATANPKKHHYGKNGLLIHTAEVVHLCLTNLLVDVDPRSVYLAALFHDAGKMYDYERGATATEVKGFVVIECTDEYWADTTHKRQIHHITRSVLIFNNAMSGMPPFHMASSIPNRQKFVDDIIHAILAHHGRKEYGSPVTPDTKLAWLLHLCDSLSARMYDVVN